MPLLIFQPITQICVGSSCHITWRCRSVPLRQQGIIPIWCDRPLGESSDGCYSSPEKHSQGRTLIPSASPIHDQLTPLALSPLTWWATARSAFLYGQRGLGPSQRVGPRPTARPRPSGSAYCPAGLIIRQTALECHLFSDDLVAEARCTAWGGRYGVGRVGWACGLVAEFVVDRPALFGLTPR